MGGRDRGASQSLACHHAGPAANPLLTGYGHCVDVGMAPASLWDGHLVLLHESEQEHDANLVGWMRRGLEREEKVVLTRLPGEPEDRMLRLCDEAGVDPVQARLA